MELVKFPLRHSSDTLVFPAELTPEDSFGLPVTERPNHDSRLLLRHVKRNAGGRFWTNPSPVLAAGLAAEHPSPPGLLADGRGLISGLTLFRMRIGSIIGVYICLGNLKVGNGSEDQKKTN